MGDLVVDIASLNRRSKLPARIIQGRPQGQAKQLLWNTINTQEQEETRPAKQITRTAKKYTTPPKNTINMTDAQKRRRREQDESLRREEKLGKAKKRAEEADMEIPIQKQHIRDAAWREVDDRTIIIGTYIQTTQREGGNKTQLFRNWGNEAAKRRHGRAPHTR